MSEESDDDECVVIASKVARGLDRLSALIHQDFGYQFGSFDSGVAQIVAGFHGEEAREAARDLRVFLARTAGLSGDDLLLAVFEMGAGYWAKNDDIRARLEGVAAELERRATLK
ncbi:MAG: hypothetical protein KJS97_10450 [Alphaproteobacteria bacterium]|nr:hypothetical protein [Alphaproteobacteria bacterium]